MISLIIQREYLTRVRKKSFLVMSVLGPIIFAAYILIPMYLASMEDREEKTVVVIDNSKLFTDYGPEGAAFAIEGHEFLEFKVIDGIPLEDFKTGFDASGYYAILFIPSNILSSESAIIYSTGHISMDVRNHIRRSMENEIEHLKLAANEIQDIERILAEVETSLNVRTIQWTKDGETLEMVSGVQEAVGYMGGFLVFFFIILFGSQVMRGVIEEKISRIIEVIVSSVKPFQLMMGKIIGVGLTGLTQFIIWIVFSGLLIVAVQAIFFPELTQTPTEQVMESDLFSGEALGGSLGEAGPDMNNAMLQSGEVAKAREIFDSLKAINPGIMVASFLFYFIFGYLLYASMFAVVGSMVDNETDTQQLILPVILPLIIGIYVMVSAMNNPEGSLPFWFSIIPFTSPVVMMVRIPFGVPWWQIALSASLLIATFVGMTWVAGKVYRTGILMYGKKNNYREIWKWLRYNS
jgi:ABC-2 type transport system permease protein